MTDLEFRGPETSSRMSELIEPIVTLELYEISHRGKKLLEEEGSYPRW